MVIYSQEIKIYIVAPCFTLNPVSQHQVSTTYPPCKSVPTVEDQSGKRASSYIDKYLGGDGIIEPASDSIENGQPYDGTRARGFADLPRMTTPTLPLAERLEGFKEVDLCPSDDEAIAEAARCLQCDMEHRLALIARSCTEQHST